MARARVELRGSMSHTGGPRTFKKGQPQVLTNPDHIEYYRKVGGFSVTNLKDEKAKPGKKPAPADTSGGDDGDDEDDVYTEADLKKMKVPELHDLAAELELEVDPDAKKADIIEVILNSQE